MARYAPGGLVYHVLNRANGRLRMFEKEEDYLAFQRVLLAAHRRNPLRVLDWCLMPNHFHLVLWIWSIARRAKGKRRRCCRRSRGTARLGTRPG